MKFWKQMISLLVEVQVSSWLVETDFRFGKLPVCVYNFTMLVVGIQIYLMIDSRTSLYFSAFSAAIAALASPKLFISPCLPFCSMSVSPYLVALILDSRSTLQIEGPSRLFFLQLISCLLLAIFVQLEKRLRDICCSYCAISRGVLSTTE